MFKKNQEIGDYLFCANCKNHFSVSENFIALSKDNVDYPCCSQKCIDELHEKLTGQKPIWTKGNKK
jgi:predicted sulfurtransferase